MASSDAARSPSCTRKIMKHGSNMEYQEYQSGKQSIFSPRVTLC